VKLYYELYIFWVNQHNSIITIPLWNAHLGCSSWLELPLWSWCRKGLLLVGHTIPFISDDAIPYLLLTVSSIQLSSGCCSETTMLSRLHQNSLCSIRKRGSHPIDGTVLRVLHPDHSQLYSAECKSMSWTSDLWTCDCKDASASMMYGLVFMESLEVGTKDPHGYGSNPSCWS